ncbi:MAG: serine hydrolase domain-containing protein [Pseudomonadota bacterium]
MASATATVWKATKYNEMNNGPFSEFGIFLDAYFSGEGPGVVLGVIDNDGQKKIHNGGMADIEACTPATADTRFELASVTKMITATIVMKLFEQGKIDLQEPAAPHIGVSNKNARAVTIRDLLQHTSGLPDYLETGALTPQEELKRSYVLNQLPCWFEHALPGQSFNYSNTNYVILAHLVETLTGQQYARHLKTVFQSLKMSNTGSVVNPEKEPLELAIGYTNMGYGTPQFDKCPESDIDTEGDGGLFSSATDLLTWQHAFWNAHIVNRKTIEMMIQPGRTDDGQTFPYGLGLQVESATGKGQWFGHGGSWVNSTTLVGHYPGGNTSVVVLSNEVVAPVERISQRAMQLLNF